MNIRFISTLIAIGLLGFSSASAQKKMLTETQEYYDVVFKARNAVYSGPHRVETTDEDFKDGSVVASEYTLSEYASGDRSRYLIRSVNGDKKHEEETIILGDYRYFRINDQPWTKTLRERYGSGSGSGTGGGTCTVRQLSVEQTFLGNHSARLFELIELRTERSTIIMEEKRTWVSDDGTLLQEETVKSLFEPRVMNSRYIRKYEVNPDLRIAAPIQ